MSISLNYIVHSCPDNIDNGWEALEHFDGNIDEAFHRMELCDKNSVFPLGGSIIRTKNDIMRRVEKVKRQYPHLQKLYQERGGDEKLFDLLIARQELLGMFSNISLSVHPKIKHAWKIQFELFGTFWNTELKNHYCCMFPEIEKQMGGVANAWHFTPKNGIYLVNPPYTEEAIEKSLMFVKSWILDKKSRKLRFVIVIPVWDKKTRQEFGIYDDYDMPAINQFLNEKFVLYHKVINDFPFFDYLKRKEVEMPGVYIHFIIAEKVK